MVCHLELRGAESEEDGFPCDESDGDVHFRGLGGEG